MKSENQLKDFQTVALNLYSDGLDTEFFFSLSISSFFVD